jgi:hypothetical protein
MKVIQQRQSCARQHDDVSCEVATALDHLHLDKQPQLSKQRISFLSLPAEIRNQIYERALRLKSRRKTSHLYGRARLVAVRTEHITERQTQQFKETNLVRVRNGVGLLGTCKQILNETAPMFFTGKILVFEDGTASNILCFLTWCKQVNVLKYIMRFDIMVKTPVTDRSDYQDWLCALGILRDAHGLREVRMCFDHALHRWHWRNPGVSEAFERLGKHIELARDKEFATALTRLRRLDCLRIRGFYNKEWTAILDRKMGPAFVIKSCGFHCVIYDPEPSCVNRAKLLHVAYVKPDQVTEEVALRGAWERKSKDGPLVTLTEAIGA